MTHLFRSIFIAAICVIVSACAGTIPRDYAGPDAGHLVVALGASAETKYSSYTLMYRKKGDKAEGMVRYLQENMFSPTKRDFDHQTENGFVAVHSLPAGEYEIYNFDVFFNGGMIQTNFGSRQDFSIPFTIIPGKAVYLGDFMAVSMTGNNIFGMSVRNGAYFVISDKQGRDLPIAKAKVPLLGNVEVAIPQATAIGNPLLRNSRP
jgi:hypothetical protein